MIGGRAAMFEQYRLKSVGSCLKFGIRHFEEFVLHRLGLSNRAERGRKVDILSQLNVFVVTF